MGLGGHEPIYRLVSREGCETHGDGVQGHQPLCPIQLRRGEQRQLPADVRRLPHQSRIVPHAAPDRLRLQHLDRRRHQPA